MFLLRHFTEDRQPYVPGFSRLPGGGVAARGALFASRQRETASIKSQAGPARPTIREVSGGAPRTAALTLCQQAKGLRDTALVLKPNARFAT